MKALLITVFAVLAFYGPVISADVFVGWNPYDMTIDEGDRIVLPVFFLTPEWKDLPVEFFVLAGVPADVPARVYCYTPDGEWQLIGSEASAVPAASVTRMYEWANVMFSGPVHPPLEGMDSFELTFCVDGTVDGRYTDETADCGTKRFNVYLNFLPSCDGIFVRDINNREISRLEMTTGVTGTATSLVFVVDGCGYRTDFKATTSASWLQVFEDTGVLVLVANAEGLEEGQTYTATVYLERESWSTILEIIFQVTNTMCPPTVCMPSG